MSDGVGPGSRAGAKKGKAQLSRANKLRRGPKWVVPFEYSVKLGPIFALAGAATCETTGAHPPSLGAQYVTCGKVVKKNSTRDNKMLGESCRKHLSLVVRSQAAQCYYFHRK